MKTTRSFLSALALFASHPAAQAALTDGMQEGAVKLESISQIAFGPEGILFIADPRAASVVAIATGDTKPSKAAAVKVESFDTKLAALLGAQPDRILIHDLAVNPLSKDVYVAVSRGRGPDATPLIARVNAGGRIDLVDLESARFSVAKLPDAPAEDPGARNNPRLDAITDLAFLEDRLLIAGLSNEEFSSNFRAIPFPFKTVPDGTSVEIFHGAHGRFETRSPVRTFVPFQIGGDPVLLAAYTCTPLVQIPLKALTPGAKIKGKTIAELGNRNRPLDMITYQKDGKDYVLMANSSRGVMKISTDNIEAAESIVSKVDGGGTRGQPYETLADWTGVDQLDKLDEGHAVVLHRPTETSLALEARPLP